MGEVGAEVLEKGADREVSKVGGSAGLLVIKTGDTLNIPVNVHL